MPDGSITVGAAQGSGICDPVAVTMAAKVHTHTHIYIYIIYIYIYIDNANSLK